jgi:hypothetical protein
MTAPKCTWTLAGNATWRAATGDDSRGHGDLANNTLIWER